MSSESPVQLVTEQRALESCCAEWRDAGCLAFDTEFIRDETYDAILCLVQATAGERVVLIDPTADLDLRPFWELVCDPAVATIVHAGKEDFEVCLTATGRPPRNVFDVQIAAGFAGYGYPLNLVRLIGQVSGHRIAKGQTLTDWLRRPLTEAQLRYAVDDVAHLPEAYRRLVAALTELGRLEWAREEFARFEDPAFYRPPASNRVLRLKGARRLDGVGLVALELLLRWRDDWARSRNRPTRAMMRDDILVEIARRRPTRATDLQVLRGFPQARNPRVIEEILEVIRRAEATPRSERPEPPEPREYAPMVKATLDLLSAFARATCFKSGVSLELVGGPQRLRELVDYLQHGSGERPALLTGWREKFIGRDLVGLLEGRKELHFSGWPSDIRLEIVSPPAGAQETPAHGA